MRKVAKNLKELHELVRYREDNTCQICWKWFPDNMCCPHHVKTRGSRPDLKHDPDNCILVDLSCHNKIHSGQVKIISYDKGMLKVRDRKGHVRFHKRCDQEGLEEAFL